MNLNEKQTSMVKELLKNTAELIKLIENYKKHDSYKESYIKILLDIEKVLASQPLDLERLGKDEFGIFRLVTDGPGDSPVEQELISLLKKFYLFRQAIKEISDNSN